MIHLDTHVIVWMYAGAVDKLSTPARDAIESSDAMTISPMVRLELQYLFEIGRVAEPAGVVLDELSRRIGLRESDARLADVVLRAASLHWTRDPFDRLIVANALADGAPLFTADAYILRHEPSASWD